jgi:hypothetical protein
MAQETGVTPIRWDLTGEDAIIQGADWTRYMALYYDDPVTGEEKLWDTTGYTAHMVIRATLDSSGSMGITTSSGELVTGFQGPNNQYCLSIRLTAARTKGLVDWGLGVWDLDVTDPYGHVTRVYEGRAALSREVGR